MSNQGYFGFLKENAAYRRLWLGNIINFLGDWFNTIALYLATYQLAEEGATVFGFEAVPNQTETLVLFTKLIPGIFSVPLTGPMIDRFDIRRLLVGANILQSITVVGIIVAVSAGSLEGIYICLFVLMSLSTLFVPGQQAALPSLVPAEKLSIANALGGATWSIMLALGAAAGGLFVQFFGIQAALWIDAVTFILSAWVLWGLPPIHHQRADVQTHFWAGLRYLYQNPRLALLTLMRPAMGLMGGAIAVLPLFANGIFTWQGPAIKGFLFMCRGLGALAGSLLIGRFLKRPSDSLPLLLTAFIVATLNYTMLWITPNLWSTAGLFFVGAICTGAIWVAAGTAMQLEANPAYLGRMTAIDMGLLTFAMSASTFAVGLGTQFGVPIRKLGALSGVMGCIGIAIVLWAMALAKRHQNASH